MKIKDIEKLGAVVLPNLYDESLQVACGPDYAQRECAFLQEIVSNLDIDLSKLLSVEKVADMFRDEDNLGGYLDVGVLTPEDYIDIARAIIDNIEKLTKEKAWNSPNK